MRPNRCVFKIFEFYFNPELLSQLVRRRQLKAQTVQRQLEEVAVRQIELEQQSLQIGKYIQRVYI